MRGTTHCGSCAAARGTIRVSKVKSASAAGKLGWPASHVGLLLFLLTADQESEFRGDKPFIDYGFFRAETFEHDWMTGTFPKGLWCSGIPQNASDAPGLLQVVFRVLRFGFTRSHRDLASALDEISRLGNVFAAIPAFIRAYLPIQPWGDTVAAQIARVRGLNESELASALQQAIGGDKLQRPHVGIYTGQNKSTSSQWLELTKDLPNLAMISWCEDWLVGERRPKWLDSPANVNALIEALETKPDLAASWILTWGKLLAAAPKREAQLRGLMLRATSRTAPPQFFRTRSLYAYPIDLVQERTVLPTLAAALVELFAGFHREFTWGADKKRKTAEELFSGFGLSRGSLSEIAQQSQHEANVRAAALTLWLLQAAHGKAGRPEPLPMAQSADGG
jgi:hypothetical protein